MNIFYLSHNTTECAKFHNDKHVVKMILEYSQLLSTAHRVLDGHEHTIKSASGRNKKAWKLTDFRDIMLYSATHINHPSAIWVRQSRENYSWLCNLLSDLLNEYTYRYGKIHKCSMMLSYLKEYPKNLRNGVFTQPTPAMPNEFIVRGNSLESYRNYYNGSKQHLAKWKNRQVPSWYFNIEGN